MSGDMVCVDKKQLTNFAGDLGEHMYFVSSADCQFWGDLVGQNHHGNRVAPHLAEVDKCGMHGLDHKLQRRGLSERAENLKNNF